MSDTLLAHLRAALHAAPDGALCVAYSGGPDSTAVLHALAQLPEARARGLRALHVDHGLQAQSADWARRCLAACAGWNVPCTEARVDVQHGSGIGIEAAARAARYAAFERELQPGERLVLAQHRDDQAETVLLKLLRGAGPEGLGGMRVQRAFGRGWIWRPVLDLPRTALADHLARHRLPSIDDPSNRDTRFGRNLLRHEILPRLREQWPHAVQSIVHSAALSREAADALEAAWRPRLPSLCDPQTGSLDAAGWLALAPGLRHPLLDGWLHARGLPAPTAAQRRQIERQCLARAGRSPCVRWAGAELHIWKGRLWALSTRSATDPAWSRPWRGEPLDLPGGGSLGLEPAHARLTAPLTVRLRRGGERIKPDGDRFTRELRDLFQQAALPPWERGTCPLLYAGDELVAVADRWSSARGAAIFAAAGATPRWSP